MLRKAWDGLDAQRRPKSGAHLGGSPWAHFQSRGDTGSMQARGPPGLTTGTPRVGGPLHGSPTLLAPGAEAPGP